MTLVFVSRRKRQTGSAACYTRDANKQLKLLDDPANSQYLQAPTFLSGGGGLVGTLADYHRFTEMLRRGGELDGVRLLGPRNTRTNGGQPSERRR